MIKLWKKQKLLICIIISYIRNHPCLERIRLALDDGEEALRLLTIYTRANPDDKFCIIGSRIGLFWCLRTMMKRSNCLRNWFQDTDLRRYAYTYLGRAFMAQGNMEEALPALSSGAALNPYSYEAHYYLAQGYHIEEQSTNGFRSYVSALKQDMTEQERISVLYDFALFCEDFDLRDEAEPLLGTIRCFLGMMNCLKISMRHWWSAIPQYKPTSTPDPNINTVPKLKQLRLRKSD